MTYFKNFRNSTAIAAILLSASGALAATSAKTEVHVSKAKRAPANASTYLSALIITPENAHSLNPQCPSGWTPVGQVVDSGGGRPNGMQQMCAQYLQAAQVNLNSVIIADVMVTPGHARGQNGIVGGPPCPNGYTQISTTTNQPATVTDCTWGSCNGNQKICVLKVTVSDAIPGVSEINITDQSQRNTSCQSNEAQLGNVADCSMGNCSGNQLFCGQQVGRTFLNQEIQNATQSIELQDQNSCSTQEQQNQQQDQNNCAAQLQQQAQQDSLSCQQQVINQEQADINNCQQGIQPQPQPQPGFGNNNGFGNGFGNNNGFNGSGNGN